jgi:branched-subunit amino acid ABC-type transport system permease component
MEGLASLLFSQFMSGLTRSMVLFVVAAGLSLVFGVLSVLNFAHGTLYMIGAFLCYTFWSLLMKAGISFWAGVILAAVGMGIIGFIIEVGLIRRTYKGALMGHVPQLLLTYALTLIAMDVVRLFWGGKFYSISRPDILAGSVSMFGVQFPSYQIFVIIVGFAIFAGLWMLIYKTRLGRIVRAAVFNREMVSALGIPVHSLYTLIFVLGSALAGLAGGIAAPLGTISVGMDHAILIECFAVVIIGGVGNVTGTLLGALVVGLVHAFGILILPQITIAFIFIILAIVLIVRPSGLLGQQV